MELLPTANFLQILAVVTLVDFAGSEVFTSLSDLQKVLLTEKDIALEIKSHIEMEEERLKRLKKVAEDYERHSQEALSDIEKHLGNPVNAYLLVKRFTIDWERIVDGLVKANSTDLIARLHNRGSEFPVQEDFEGAATALLRLQDTYNLPTAQIAKGELQGVKNSPEMTAEDCFELGRTAYNAGDYYHCILWMEEALNTLDTEVNKTADRALTIDYLAYSLYRQCACNPSKAIQTVSHVPGIIAEECFVLGKYAYTEGNWYHTVNWMQQALAIWHKEEVKTVGMGEIMDYLAYALTMSDPNHPRAVNNLRYYEKLLETADQEKKRGEEEDLPEIQNQRLLDDYRKGQEFKQYEALCRGEDIIPDPNKHKLKCRYTHNNRPNLLLRPLKEEEAFLDPRILFYHNMLSDFEIETIKRLAAPKLIRATVQNPQTLQLEPAKYRISKSAWLKEDEDAVIKRVNQRIKDVTQLDMTMAEDLQVANYGIGGHYEPHFDFARKDESSAFDTRVGNRIATLLNYMSDVTAGGATVFIPIGVKVFPKKGSAVFWHNLYRSGEGDFRTRHAACPVLVGQKWVSNKWIHERGNELVRTCGLSPYE
ncbi:prolyl 4-hydroxylase subunit alpha-2-like [Lingula anatina]|uniref:procollagen-proline 4-dioxygenase n=1 Tax=Lingula anatina TaxID=7574 RepID=A0A2R2MPW3_LINAN|nr:prolyl 4-hydroxylase subunit alpha-2-like [Lingula anatina]|eukprot:XP_023932280.1 prolyl 4-hydroxylase subunit alpha-2-like [Lingula anatina]